MKTWFFNSAGLTTKLSNRAHLRHLEWEIYVNQFQNIPGFQVSPKMTDSAVQCELLKPPLLTSTSINSDSEKDMECDDHDSSDESYTPSSDEMDDNDEEDMKSDSQ